MLASMDLVSTFAETVEDLRLRSSLTSTSYDAVQAAGLMRRLLIDGGAVADRATKELRERGWYERKPVCAWGVAFILRTGPSGSVWVSREQLDPALMEPLFNLDRAPDALDGWIRRGSVKDLLKVTVLEPDDSEIGAVPSVTAQQLIQHFAIVLGGVHHGARPRTPPPELILRAVEVAMPDLLWVMRALGRIVVRAYEPLVCAAIVKGYRPGG